MSIHHSTPNLRPVTVYFIQAGESGPIKIGHTRHPVSMRLLALQSGNSETLHLRGTIAGHGKIERSIHRRFAPLRIRGEWFQPTEELLAYIALRSKRPGTVSGAVHFLLSPKLHRRAFRKGLRRKVRPRRLAPESVQECELRRGRRPVTEDAGERERHIDCARLYFGTGWSVARIARNFDVCRDTVYRWVRLALTYDDPELDEIRHRFARTSKRGIRP